jgi:hypothetical protein
MEESAAARLRFCVEFGLGEFAAVTADISAFVGHTLLASGP